MLTVLVPLPKTSNENCANSHEKNHNQGQVKALLLIGSARGGKYIHLCLPLVCLMITQLCHNDFKHCESESSPPHLQRHV